METYYILLSSEDGIRIYEEEGIACIAQAYEDDDIMYDVFVYKNSEPIYSLLKNAFAWGCYAFLSKEEALELQ